MWAKDLYATFPPKKKPPKVFIGSLYSWNMACKRENWPKDTEETLKVFSFATVDQARHWKYKYDEIWIEELIRDLDLIINELERWADLDD